MTDSAGPALPGNRLVDDPQYRPTILQQRDKSAEYRAARHKADRSVNRVEHPLSSRAFVARAVFLADDPIVGALRFQYSAHGHLGVPVNFSHRRGIGLAVVRPLTAKSRTDNITGGISQTVGESKVFLDHTRAGSTPDRREQALNSGEGAETKHPASLQRPLWRGIANWFIKKAGGADARTDRPEPAPDADVYAI